MEEGKEMKEELEIVIERENYLKRIRDIKLNLLTHRFLPVDDTDWLLVRSKLISLYNTYYRKYAIRLCSKCLTIYSSNRGMNHEEISVSSVFDHIHPIKAQGDEIAAFFAKNGRTRTTDDGKVLVGVPSFDHPCLPIYRFLDGSSKPQEREENQMGKDGITLKVQEPLIVVSNTEKMVLKQKERAKPHLEKHLGSTEKKKGELVLTPIKKEKQDRYQQGIRTSEMLSKREPEKTNRKKKMKQMKVQRFDLKNTLKSPMKPPFVVSTASNSRSLLQGLIDDLNTK